MPYTVAALGGEASVETFAGRKRLNVPPGTQSGQSFRLSGLGMPKLKGGGSGDLYAKVKMTVPKDLSPRERDLLTELAKLRSGQCEGVGRRRDMAFVKDRDEPIYTISIAAKLVRPMSTERGQRPGSRQADPCPDPADV